MSHELLFKANGIKFSLDDFFRKLFLICKFYSYKCSIDVTDNSKICT